MQTCGALFSCIDVSFLQVYSKTSSHVGFPEFKSVSLQLSKTTVLCLGSPSLHSDPELLWQKAGVTMDLTLFVYFLSQTLVTYSDISFIT